MILYSKPTLYDNSGNLLVLSRVVYICSLMELPEGDMW